MKRNTVLITLAMAIVAAGLGYYLFFFNSAGDSALVEGETPASDAELSFISLVTQLDPITFDTTILSDQRFISRQDIRTAIVPEASGRKDPFAPIGR